MIRNYHSNKWMIYLNEYIGRMPCHAPFYPRCEHTFCGIVEAQQRKRNVSFLTHECRINFAKILMFLCIILTTFYHMPFALTLSSMYCYNCIDMLLCTPPTKNYEHQHSISRTKYRRLLKF